jgi:hypothetical protein
MLSRGVSMVSSQIMLVLLRLLIGYIEHMWVE